MMASFGLLFGGSFSYVEVLFFIFLQMFFKLTNGMGTNMPMFLVFLVFTAAIGYAYYEILKFSVPRRRRFSEEYEE